MKLVLHLSDMGWSADTASTPHTIARIAELAEGCGFDGLAIADHLWQHPAMGGPERAQLEAYTTLGFIAAHTSRIRLLTVVTGVHFRHAAVLAKTVTTLDVLTGGRAWLGLGAGHYAEECAGLGLPFPSIATRFELVEDTLDLCLGMWTGDHGTDGKFDGRHVRAERLLNMPQAVQRPHPPILIAGDGERRTLALVARYADACSLRPTPDVPHKLDVLRRHCEDAGTDFDHIERTCAFSFDVAADGNGADELLERLAWLGSLGVETVIGRIPDVDHLAPIEAIGRHVIPRAAELEMAS